MRRIFGLKINVQNFFTSKQNLEHRLLDKEKFLTKHITLFKVKP